MEKLTLLDYYKQVPAVLLKKSDKLEARDIDEPTKDKFIAYVDEGDQSHDVFIELNQKKEIVDSGCDCENQNGLCVHKLALLRFLVSYKIKTTASKVVRKKKLTEVEELLQNIDKAALQNWVFELLKKNKDLNILFLNEFKAANTTFTATEIHVLMTATIKSIIKNRKNLDATMLKKVLDLLESSLKPVMIYVNNNIANPGGALLLHAVIKGITDFEDSIYVNSVKIQRFAEKIGNDFLSTLHNIKEQTVWETIVADLFNVFCEKNKKSYHLYELNFIESIYDSSTNKTERNKFFVAQEMHFFKHLQDKKIHIEQKVLLKLMNKCQETGVLKEYIGFFKPIKYENTYNEQLLTHMISFEMYKQAIDICEKQILGNYYESYNVAYYEIIKKIYQIQNNQEGLLQLTSKLLFINYNFDDYLHLKANKNLLNFEDLKLKLFKLSASVLKSHNTAAQAFYIKLFIEENEVVQLTKTLEKINSLEPIISTFNELLPMGRTNLLKTVCKIDSFNSWSISQSNLTTMRNIIKDNFTIVELEDFKKSSRLQYSHRLIEPILEKRI